MVAAEHCRIRSALPLPRSTQSGLRLSAENSEEQGRGLAPGQIACGGSVNRCQQRQGTSVELIAQCRQAPGRSCAMLIALGWLPEVGGGGFHGTSLPAVSRFQNVAMGYNLPNTYTWKRPRIGKRDPSMSGAMWQELPWSCQKAKSPGKLRWARQEPPTHQMTNASAGSAAGVQRYIYSMRKAGCRASTRYIAPQTAFAVHTFRAGEDGVSVHEPAAPRVGPSRVEKKGRSRFDSAGSLSSSCIRLSNMPKIFV